MHKELLQDAVERAGLSRDDAAKIPVVPTSYRQTSLPGVANWYNDFWITGLSRTKYWSKFFAMLQITSESWIQDQRAVDDMAVEVARRLTELGDKIDAAYSEEDKEFQSLATGKDPIIIMRIIICVYARYHHIMSSRYFRWCFSATTSVVYRFMDSRRFHWCRFFPSGHILFAYFFPFVTGLPVLLLCYTNLITCTSYRVNCLL